MPNLTHEVRTAAGHVVISTGDGDSDGLGATRTAINYGTGKWSLYERGYMARVALSAGPYIVQPVDEEAARRFVETGAIDTRHAVIFDG